MSWILLLKILIQTCHSISIPGAMEKIYYIKYTIIIALVKIFCTNRQTNVNNVTNAKPTVFTFFIWSVFSPIGSWICPQHCKNSNKSTKNWVFYFSNAKVQSVLKTCQKADVSAHALFSHHVFNTQCTFAYKKKTAHTILLLFWAHTIPAWLFIWSVTRCACSLRQPPILVIKIMITLLNSIINAGAAQVRKNF